MPFSLNRFMLSTQPCATPKKGRAPSAALVGGACPGGILIILFPAGNAIGNIGNLILVHIFGIPFIRQIEDVWRGATGKGRRELLIHTTPGNYLVVNRDAGILAL